MVREQTTERRCSSFEEVVFSASLKGSGSNMRWASVSPREVMVSPPTRGLAGDTGVLPWDRASGWGQNKHAQVHGNTKTECQ